MNEESNKYLGSEKVSKLLFKFSIPCILSLLISSLYNIVDQIFIGNSEIGYLGNAATSIVFPITIISVAFAWCFGDGSAAFLSLCQGRRDTKDAHIAIGNSILINFIISLIFVLLGFIFMDNLLYLFGASETSLPLAQEYFRIILIFIPVYMLANGMNAIIRADGSPAFSMISTLAGAIINIILDPIFIFVLKFGISGAAWATIIGQCVSLIISIIYFTRTKTFKLSLTSFKINFKIFSNVIKLGISTFITQMSIVIISLACNIMLARFGAMSKYTADIPIAVMGICMKVFTIVINIVVGIILGGQPILGYNYGAKKFDRVKEVFRIILVLTIVVGVVSTILFELFPEFIIGIFGTNNSPEYIEFAVLTFRIFLSLIVCTCTIKMTSIFFQAVGNPIKATIISLVRDIVCFVPLVLVFPHFMGVVGILWAAPIADLIGIIVCIILITIFFKNLGTEKLKTKDSNEMFKILDSKDGVIITISRTHGTKGKYIGEQLAKKLDIPYYYKELTAIVAEESGLDKEFISKIDQKTNILHDLYLSTTPVKYAIEAQEKVIKDIASRGSCVIVGRAADYVLRDNPKLVRIFIYANDEYRINSVMEMYGDTLAQAKKNIVKTDKNRASYYNIISNRIFGENKNYDLCIDSSIGVEKTVNIIYDYIKNINN
ncbi:MAG: MATE family efflux transporter [Clostridium sp.]|nr:MATE family efflux transporter [Clostridium sp.]MCM1443949.1 MATE family efflux transporter [Candidatus Amulumruptor caecigallinarius]